MKKTDWRFVPVVLAFLTALGVSTVFSACDPLEDGSWMGCHSAQLLSLYFSVGLFVLYLSSALLNSRLLRIVFYPLSMAVCVLLFLTPGVLVHLCQVGAVRCHAFLQPFVRVMAVLLLGTSVYPLILSLRNR